MYTPLKSAKAQKTDFDVVARISQIHEMDAYTNELKLRDASGSTWYTLALKLKFPHLKVGQAVRIRSATVDETSSAKQVLALSHYSNIMTFIVQDLLDYAQIKAGKFRKNFNTFNIRESVEKVMCIQRKNAL